MKTTTEISSMYYEALERCGIRYYDMLDARFQQDLANGLIWSQKDIELDEFICLFQRSVDNREPIAKLNRWLGYIQGCLIERGYTDVETERNWTRPLFRHLDYPTEG